MLVTIAVLGILVGMAAPGLGKFLDARRIEDAARRMTEDLNLARNEAVKRNAVVHVCAAASGDCSSGPDAADWAAGWRVCYDVDADGRCDEGSGGDPNPIRVQPAVAKGVALTGPASRLDYRGDGTLSR